MRILLLVLLASTASAQDWRGATVVLDPTSLDRLRVTIEEGYHPPTLASCTIATAVHVDDEGRESTVATMTEPPAFCIRVDEPSVMASSLTGIAAVGLVAWWRRRRAE